MSELDMVIVDGPLPEITSLLSSLGAPNTTPTIEYKATGATNFTAGPGCWNWWLFDATTCGWSDQDVIDTGRQGIEWQMEMKGRKAPVKSFSTTDFGFALTDVPRGTYNVLTIPSPRAVWTSEFRLRQHWRPQANVSLYACPFNLTLRIDGDYYVIPDLWLQVDKDGYYAVNSNWKNYSIYYPWSAGSHMEVYGYRHGDFTKPVVLEFTSKKDMIRNRDNTLTGVKVVREITCANGELTAWQDEFNWRMALMHFNNANARVNDNDQALVGLYGYDLSRYALDGANWLKPGVPLGKLPQAHIVLGQQEVVASVKDMYIMDQGHSDSEVEYTQEFTVQNDMDTQQSVKANDFAWAYTESDSYQWGFKEQIAVKLTVKWETDLTTSFFFGETKVKFTVQIEAGYTQEFTQTHTWTTTNTRTFTMSGQSVSLPAKSAAHVAAVMMKVKGSAQLGNAVEIVEDPRLMITHIPDPQTPYGMDGIMPPAYAGDMDLAKAAKWLGMVSIKTEHVTKEGKKLVGAFCKPVLDVKTAFGAAGSVRVSPAPYVPLKDAADEQVQVRVLGAGNA